MFFIRKVINRYYDKKRLPLITAKNTKEIHHFFLKYLNTYFNDRDLESTLKMFHKKLSGFGTGFDEKIRHYSDVKKLYSRDIKQAPNRIHYKIKKLDINMPVTNTGIISSEIDIKTLILGQEIIMNDLRFSMFVTKCAEEWFIEHMHLSFPTIEHEQDEAYPLIKLEDRNKVLQRLVDEKTASLQITNEKLQQALNEVKTLRGIIPICSHCKKIRSDDESWQRIEEYLKQHSDAEFSHGICPECLEKYYSDLYPKI